MSNETSNGSANGANGDRYYYVQGKKISVEHRDDLVAVMFPPREAEEASRAFAESHSVGLEPTEEFNELQQGRIRIYKVGEGYELASRALSQTIETQPGVEKVGNVYTDESGRPLVLTDELVCKFKPELTADRIATINATYGLEIVESLGFSENGYLLRVKPGVSRNALEIANALVEHGEAVYAAPNWVEYIGFRSMDDAMLEEIETAIGMEETRHTINDPLYTSQWHLDNTGQGGGTVGADVRAHNAWHTTLGDPGIRIAIIDGGVDIRHEDLADRVVAPKDFRVTPPDNDPSGSDGHGTSCAGVAVATQNNSRGVSGIAPGCRLIPLGVAADGTQLQIAHAVRYAADNQADVISCSLGPDGRPWPLTDQLRESLDYATTYGRNGRGCVIFWAGGNGNESISTDGVASYERTVAVGASTNQDRRASYSDFGPELDIMAPSNGGTRSITTTTTTGLGSSTVDPSRNYTGSFGGTSSASPLAAGVAALALSVNRGLSWEEARQTLIDSAEKIDAAANPYTTAPLGRPPGTRNDRYGYGRVNAERALGVARAGLGRDLYIRDTTSDSGTVPQPNWGFWDSPDIWVRNTADGDPMHQDTIRGRDNFIYARVWNRGTRASLPCWVRIYITSWAHAEFRYPYDYKPDTTMAPGGGTPGRLRPRAEFPTPATYFVGMQRIESIPAGMSSVVNVRWERGLIPPELGWHPCLLVEVSPHDGPAPTGEYVWQNNNLGQKNISIINVMRGEMVEYPFYFGHPMSNDEVIRLNIKRVKAPANLQLYLDVKEPALLKEIATLAGLKIPKLPVKPIDIVKPIVDKPVIDIMKPDIDIIKPVKPGTGKLPLKLTFLEDARIALHANDDRSEEGGMIFTFPRGSSLELGSGALPEIVEGSDDIGGVEMEERGWEESVDLRQPYPTKPPFSVATFSGAQMLAIENISLAKITVPTKGKKLGGYQQSSLRFRIPQDAKPGDVYRFEVGATNAKGVLVGGVSLQVRVTK